MQNRPAGNFIARAQALPDLGPRGAPEEETVLMAQETKLMPAGVPRPAAAAMGRPSPMPPAPGPAFGASFEWPAPPHHGQAAPAPQPYNQGPAMPQSYVPAPQAYGQAPYGHAPAQHAPTAHHAMQPPPTLPPPSPMPMSPYGHPNAYGAPSSYPPPAPQPGAFGYGQPAPAQHAQAPGFHLGGPLGGAVGGAAMGALSKMPQPAGLPSVIAFGLGIVAVLVALIFDVVFLKVHIPGVGGYAWYLTTALSFAGAGFGGAKWTRASQGTAYVAVAFAGILYGLADIGLGVVLEDLAMSSAAFLGIQGLVIAVVCGGGGVRRGMAAKEDDEEG